MASPINVSMALIHNLSDLKILRNGPEAESVRIWEASGKDEGQESLR